VKRPEGDRLDAALDLFHDHRWRENKPDLSREQFAELLMAVWPFFARELNPKRTRVSRPKPAKVGQVGGPAPGSSHIPLAIRRAVLARDERCCQRCGRSIWGMRYGLQHRRPRQMGGSKRLHTMANLVVLCGWTTDPGTCTAWVELEDRKGAERDGWLVPLGADPEDWPVLRFGTKWMQPGDGWSESLPHPRQVEMGAVA
jgi:hypothetical protein